MTVFLFVTASVAVVVGFAGPVAAYRSRRVGHRRARGRRPVRRWAALT
jgi:hypothetical protein